MTAPTQAGRSVTFTGQMETVAGAHRMAIEIVVQEHTAEEEGFHTLTTAGLGSWQRSEAGVKIYKVRQAVTDLPAPAVFRAIVRYRWLNEKGQVIRHDERRTPICRQPGERTKAAATPAKPARADPGQNWNGRPRPKPEWRPSLQCTEHEDRDPSHLRAGARALHLRQRVHDARHAR